MLQSEKPKTYKTLRYQGFDLTGGVSLLRGLCNSPGAFMLLVS